MLSDRALAYFAVALMTVTAVFSTLGYVRADQAESHIHAIKRDLGTVRKFIVDYRGAQE